MSETQHLRLFPVLKCGLFFFSCCIKDNFIDRVTWIINLQIVFTSGSCSLNSNSWKSDFQDDLKSQVKCSTCKTSSPSLWLQHSGNEPIRRRRVSCGLTVCLTWNIIDQSVVIEQKRHTGERRRSAAELLSFPVFSPNRDQYWSILMWFCRVHSL